MATHEFDAIGTHWALEILSEQEFTQALIDELHATADRFDQRYSRFRDDSLVAQLARTGTLLDPPEELILMMDFAKDMYGVSQGAFNIGVGATLHRLGYGKREHGHSVRKNIWDEITYSSAKITVPKGEMLDFGGFGKGWLIELFMTIMQGAGVTEFIVNGGGDLYCQSREPIEFKLEDPYDASVQFGQTRITHGALAVSNTVKRAWEDGDDTKHHIIDPETDDSSQSGVVASYVKADSALIADTMATILILRPELEDELKVRFDLKSILVRDYQPNVSL